jgi:hypothetical protein
MIRHTVPYYFIVSLNKHSIIKMAATSLGSILIGLFMYSCTNRVNEEKFETLRYDDQGEFSSGCALSKQSETVFIEKYCDVKVKTGYWREFINNSEIFYRKGNYLPYSIIDDSPFYYWSIKGSIWFACDTIVHYPKSGKWDYFGYDNEYLFSEYYWFGNLYFVKDIDSTISYALTQYPNKLFMLNDWGDYFIIEWYEGFNSVSNNYRDFNISNGVEWLLKDSLTNDKLISRLFIDSVNGNFNRVTEMIIYNNAQVIDRFEW